MSVYEQQLNGRKFGPFVLEGLILYVETVYPRTRKPYHRNIKITAGEAELIQALPHAREEPASTPALMARLAISGPELMRRVQLLRSSFRTLMNPLGGRADGYIRGSSAKGYWPDPNGMRGEQPVKKLRRS